MRLVGLDPARLADYPHQFSGGMRQRASIALALALEPALVIADEPVTALDVIVQRQVLDVLRELRHRLKLAMILVTHDMAVVAYACDRVGGDVCRAHRRSRPGGEVLEQPLHPYTMGLTHAFPDVHGDLSDLVPIDGAPPSLIDPPAGCRFAARCPFAQPAATPSRRRSVLMRTDHLAACWRAEEAATELPALPRAATWAAMGRAMTPVLEASGLRKTFQSHGRTVHAVNDVSLVRRARRGTRHRRRVRLRQDHHGAHAAPPGGSERRPASFRGRRYHRVARPPR